LFISIHFYVIGSNACMHDPSKRLNHPTLVLMEYMRSLNLPDNAYVIRFQEDQSEHNQQANCELAACVVAGILGFGCWRGR